MTYFTFRKPEPRYKVITPKSGQQVLKIDASTKAIRPHCLAATLRNVSFDAAKYD